MTKNKLTYWDYVKAAFHLKIKIPLLGHMPVNKLILIGFAILGIGHPGFWFLGLAYEAFYLLSLSGNERFQKYIQATTLEKISSVYSSNKQRLYDQLDKESKARYDRLFRLCIDVLQIAEHIPGALGKKELESQGLNQLQWIFLKLLNSRLVILKILSEINETDLLKEIQKLQKSIDESPENSSIRRSLEGMIEIQQRRLENIEKAKSNLKITETELDRIENQIKLLKEELAVSNDADLLGMRLDGVMDSIRSTTQWMATNADLFVSDDDGFIPSDRIKITQ